MIQRLHISNYALISSIDIEFQEGLNIITGETGAGKSIILGALSLILGGRADLKAIRDESKKSVIEGIFEIKNYGLLKDIFNENDIDWVDDSCILRRELSPNGRSRAFINDMPVTLQQLHDVALHLIDIHSQHQNLLLANHDYQLAIIDTLAGNAELLQEYQTAFHTYRKALRKYTETRDMIMRNKADAEYISFQLEQLNEMNLVQGEQESLEHEREVQSNMTEIKDAISCVLDSLSRADNDVLTRLSYAASHMDRLNEVLDNAASLSQRLESARLEIQDIAETLQDYDNQLSADPSALEQIEDRLSKIYSLEARHHVDSSDDLIALRDKLKTQLHDIDNADESLQRLEDEAKAAKKEAMLLARQLSDRRKAQAEIFSEELRERAMPLGMKNLRCEVTMTQGKLSTSGIDTIDFRFAFNKNQPLMSVGATASGGEISRLILAIKFVISEKMQMPTIIFDEVDTGVSGDIAVRMANLMAQISDRSQVIAITHLPQVASKGSTHFKVYKEDDETSTNTHIRMLSEEERIGEIALMLSGNADDKSAREAAKSLLAPSTKQ